MVEKDRFGDKLRDKEKAEEDRFFAERDREALQKLRAEDAAAAPVETGRCPRCLTAMTQRKIEQVTIDECPSGHGVWLDAGELESLRGEKQGWLSQLVRRSVTGIR
jgi:hypothetical protein